MESLQFMELKRDGHNWADMTYTHTSWLKKQINRWTTYEGMRQNYKTLLLNWVDISHNFKFSIILGIVFSAG